ncbi:MAG: PD-(D/E)XK nuclease superfamily protein [Firmicutes bacterium ADurb.Bin182]|nr:MAG: PD-(D/E)XK nuclease superfamily protein [Firmicutes bacterium ADurb.Bin182]
MPPKGHAVLSASSSERWLHCPPSARLCESYEDKGSDYAAEGTDAHELCEYKLRKALGMEAQDPTENLTWFNEEMSDCANGYAAYVLEQVEDAKQTCADPIVLIEQRVDFSRWVESGYGTADCIIIADSTLQIIDYKHGLGVLVSAEKNPQMQCYALGALELFDDIYDIDSVRMTIYQPRRDNVSTYEISKDELYRWADEVLKPTADLAFVGDGNFLCGEWCGFCKAKHDCRARADANMELARYDFKLPPLLTDEEVEEIISRVDDFVAWASDIKDYALQQAISGKEWNGWKLVEGRSNRKYTNETAVAGAVADAGFDPYERKVLGVTAMQKLLGKSRFEELLAAYIEKPQGKPTLVPESDKRPVMNTAKNDFMEENNYE